MKKIGFIRWKGFIPFIIIALLWYVFVTFFMDRLLKKAIEKNATKMNGALVEMKSLNLSFLSSSLKIKGLQVANPNNLMQNRVDAPLISLDFRFLPLLKLKFVTEEIKITDVRWLTARKTKGEIPKAWQEEWDREAKEPSFLDPIIAQAMQNLKNSVKSELPDISVDSLKKQFDPREIKIEDLSSYKKTFEIKSKAEESYKKWDTDGKQLIDSQKKFISDTKAKLSSLDPNNMKDPQSIISAISTVSSFEKDIKSNKDLLTGRLQEAKTEVQNLASQAKSVSDLIKSDTKGIIDKYSFGNLSIDNFSKQIFGMQWIPYYQKYVTYSVQLKKYLAKYKSTKKEEVKPERFKGVDIHFPITDNTPKFLIQKINLSAQANEKAKDNELWRGKYELKVADISSDQKLYGKPTTADANMETYGGAFASAFGNLIIDHREEPTKDNLKLGIKNFKLAGATLGKESVFPLPIKQGFADATISAGLLGDKTDITVELNVKDALYQFAKSNNYLVTLIQDVVNKINSFKVDIKFFGTLQEPKFTISSTLDNAIASGIKQVFMAKLDEVRTKAEKYINEEIGKNLEQAKGKIAFLDNNVTKVLGDQLKGIDFLSGDVKSKIDALKKRQGGQLLDKINVPGEQGDVKNKLKGLFGK